MGSTYRFRSEKLREPSGTPGVQPVIVAVCGSFNPIHMAHLALYSAAKERLLREGGADGVQRFEVLGGFLSPVGDGYGKPGLRPLSQRAAIIEHVLRDHPELALDDWEGLQLGYTRTVHVLCHLEDVAREWQRGTRQSAVATPVRVVLACGADLFGSFFQPGCWPLPLLRALLDRFPVVVVGRPGHGNRVEVLEGQARDPLRCVLRGESDGEEVTLDLSTYDFFFTTFELEDDTSSTAVRALAKRIADARTPPEEVERARRKLSDMEPASVIDWIIRYYGE